MQHRFDIVIFDLGHTLLRFDTDWREVRNESTAALLKVLQADGYQLNPEQFAEDLHERFDYYFHSKEQEWREYTTEYILTGLLYDYGYEDVPIEELRPAIDAMYAVSQQHWLLEEDTIPMLETLREQGYRIGLISNAADDKDVQTLVDVRGLREFFDVVIVSAGVGIRKPSAEIFRMALEHWGANPDQAVMIGDTLNADVLGAQNVGMSSVWITRRGMRPDNLEIQDVVKPDASIGTLSELPGLLSSWNGRGRK